MRTKAEWQSLYDEHGTIEKVARAIGFSAMTTYRRLKAAGVALALPGAGTRGKPWSDKRRAATPPPTPKRTREQWRQSAIGNKSITSHGYVRVQLGAQRRQYEHILIAEKVLGRKLRRNERVHHIDENKQNNANSNLLICTHAYHLALHARMRRHPQWRIERNGNRHQQPQE